MDFVTGTSVGITGQMDIKIDGLKYEIMEAALAQASDGRAYPWKTNRNFSNQKRMLKLIQKSLQRRILMLSLEP
jgi:polyribonucleotide nucleotidyltransferase